MIFKTTFIFVVIALWFIKKLFIKISHLKPYFQKFIHEGIL